MPIYEANFSRTNPELLKGAELYEFFTNFVRTDQLCRMGIYGMPHIILDHRLLSD